MNDLKVVPLLFSESGDHVVERLEEALVMAKEGHITNVVLVMTSIKDEVISCYANVNDPFLMVGCIESIKRDFMDASIEQREYD